MNDRRRPRECFDMDRDGVTKHVCLDPFCGCQPKLKFHAHGPDPWVAFFGNRPPNTNEPYPVRWHVPEASPFATSLRKHERLMALISRALDEPEHKTDAQ